MTCQPVCRIPSKPLSFNKMVQMKEISVELNLILWFLSVTPRIILLYLLLSSVHFEPEKGLFAAIALFFQISHINSFGGISIDTL